MDESASSIIQLMWRSHKTRRAVHVYRRLPRDVWENILHFLRFDWDNAVERYCSRRMIRLKYSSACRRLNVHKTHRKEMVRTFRFFHICLPILSRTFVEKAVRLAFYILTWHPNNMPNDKLVLNAFVEAAHDHLR